MPICFIHVSIDLYDKSWEKSIQKSKLQYDTEFSEGAKHAGTQGKNISGQGKKCV